MDDAAIAGLEACAFAAWPALRSATAAGWLVRVSAGQSKRANSANPLPGACGVEDVLGEVAAVFAAAGVPAIFRLTPLAPPGSDAVLEAAGYQLEQPSWVMTAQTGYLPAVASLRIEPAASAEWLAGIAALDGGKANPEHAAIARAIRLPAAFATLTEDGAAVGYGLAVADGSRTGLFDIVVASQARGRGLGRVLTQGLMAWGRGQGADTAWLQVRDCNAAARALYRSLGFADAYPYHYRVQPPG
jgi:ribosomal protein S18 acetylase RimI-like enzyme